MRGVPLFAEAHMERLRRSAQLAGRTGPVPLEEMIRGLKALADANGVYDGNIKLLMSWADPRGPAEWAACFIPHKYPTREDYAGGVSLALMEAERFNPNAKVVNTPLRERADHTIQAKGVYEVLMIDREGFIAEGSRSNCFFVRSGRLATPPVQQVLPGITRAHVIDICRELELTVREQPAHITELSTMDAVFITGTSPGVLPVSRIEANSFPADHPLVSAIGAAYEQRVQEYLIRHAP